VPALQAEVTRAQEAAIAAEATHVAAVVAVKTSAQEAAATRDRATAWVKDVEG
jgi:hypothetical protein